jgi:hypothetical protein
MTGAPGSQALQNKSSDQLTDEESAFVECFKLGMGPADIAKEIVEEGSEDWRARRKAIRRKCQLLLRSDKVAIEIASTAKSQMVMDLLPATKALGRRAKKGRPDAIKLLFEASGFHNSKVKHEHSGDIAVTLNMPRPPARVDHEADPDIVDAEVVEDD